MSRSYKHVPYCHFVSRHKGMKRLFNKRMRRMGIEEVGSYGAYKKANETWDDDDWRAVRWTPERYGSMLTYFDRCLLISEHVCDDELRQMYRRAFLAK